MNIIIGLSLFCLGVALTITFMTFLYPFWQWVLNLQGKVIAKHGKELIRESDRITKEVAELAKTVNELKQQENGTAGVN